MFSALDTIKRLLTYLIRIEEELCAHFWALLSLLTSKYKRITSESVSFGYAMYFHKTGP